jgi:hypothetical protein
MQEEQYTYLNSTEQPLIRHAQLLKLLAYHCDANLFAMQVLLC